MLISIHDKTLKRVAYIDNEKPGALHYTKDTWHRYLTEATSTFDFTVPKAGHGDIQFLTEKNYVSFRHGGRDYLFGIMRIEENEQELTCYCENLNLELLNEDASAYPASGAKKFVDYFNDSSQIGGQAFSDLVIGINEVADYTRNLDWEGTSTKLARLLSLVNKFDAECEFETKLNRDGSLDKIVLNVYKANDDTHQGVGTRRQDVTLYYGKTIDSVRRTIDKTNLYSAIYATGKDGLTVASLNRTEYDEDGKILYHSPPGSPHIYAPQTAQEYPAQISTNADPWILYRWEYDTDNVNTLYGQALAMLKKLSAPALTYEITGKHSLDIGDTVTIHDNKFTPTLLLQARVSEQEISFCDPTKNKNIYSNFKALENRLSTDITSRLEALVQEATPYVAEILTDNGTVFKNGEGATTLTARIMRGTADVTAQVVLQWSRDGTVISDDPSITVAAGQVQAKAVYRLTAKNAAEDDLCFVDVTVINVDDGTGINDVDIEYCQSTSNAVAPNGPWLPEAPAWEEGKYLWSRTAITYSNGTVVSTTPVCISGDHGADGVSLTAIQEQYYLSTSNTTQTGGSWTITCPPWAQGKYLWTRSRCSWSDNTTTYTTPVLADAINKANETASAANGTAIIAKETANLAIEITQDNTTEITVAQGKIETLIQDTTVMQDGQNVKLKDAYNRTVADVDGIVTTVGNQQSEISDLQNMQIGGRNIVLNTSFKTNWLSYAPSITTLTKTADGQKITWVSVGQSAMTEALTSDLVIGQKYTFSAEIRGNINLLELFVLRQAGTNQRFYDRSSVLSATTFKKIEVTFTYTSSNAKAVRIFIGGTASAVGQWIEVKKDSVKLEKGNKATDWSPAPEDAEASIAAVDGKFANYSTTTQMTSAINQKSDSILLSVQETYTTKTDFSNLKLGGRNLLKDSKTIYLLSGAADTTIKENGKITVVTSGAWDAYVFAQNNLSDKPYIFNDCAGRDFTFSADVKVNSTGVSLMCDFRTGPGQYQLFIAIPVPNTGGKWIRVSGTARYSGTPTSSQAVIWFRGTGNQGAVVEYRNMKLEEGSKATAHTNAPEDTDAAIGNVTTRVSEAELKLQPTQLTLDISTAINNGVATLMTTKFTMDRDGLTIKNGGIRIQNNAGVDVLSADTSGNLVMTGNVNLQGTSNQLTVKTAAGAEVGRLQFLAPNTPPNTTSYNAVALFGKNDLTLWAGELNQQDGHFQIFTGGYSVIEAGYNKTAKTAWLNLGGGSSGIGGYGLTVSRNSAGTGTIECPHFVGTEPMTMNSINSMILSGSSTPYIHTNTGRGAFGINIWSSDARKKDNITDATISGIDTIRQLKHRQFDWKDGRGHTGIGYVAQELAAISPEFVIKVGKGDEELLQPYTPTILPTISKALQEVIVADDERDKRIKALETEVEHLKEKLQRRTL